MKNLKALDYVALILIIVGGINWGLVGLFNFNLVARLFGPSILSNAIYMAVGSAAIYCIYLIFKLKAKEY